MLRDAIEPILGKGDLRRGLMFGLGAFLILGVLILLLVRPTTFSPAETIMVSFLIPASVVALLVMDLFD
jgi:preprotein translocase subunit SecD